MTRRTSRNTQVLTALVLIVALLAPARHTAQASPGEASAEVMARQAMAQQALAPQAAPPGNLANVPGASASWWAAVQEQVQQDVYALGEGRAEGGALSYVGHNPVHGFVLAFSANGVRLVPAGEAAWSLGLRLTSFGHEGRVQPVVGPPVMTVNGKQLEYRHAGLTEWYVNGERGLEQGFVLESPPPGVDSGQPLVFDMALETGLVPELSDDTQSIDFLTQDGSVAVLRYTDLVVVDAAGRELAAHLSVSPGSISIWIDDAGAAYPLLVDPLVITPDWTAEGDEYDSRLGYSVAAAGDVNGDGYDDVVVGASGDVQVYVYYGSATGPAAAAGWSTGGSAAAAAGDLNGDGYDDLVAVNGSVTSVYYGSDTGLGGTAAWSAGGSAAAKAGDVNGDGFDDLAIHLNTDVLVYYGSSAGLPDLPHWSVGGYEGGTAGDVNGDGYDDLVTVAGSDVSVYHGSAAGLASTAAWSAAGEVAGTAGDVNGDGYDDVIVGAPYLSNGQYHEGGVYVYHGSPSGLADAADWSAESDQAEARFGTVVGTAGDMNGDGFDDVVVGTPWFDNGEADEGGVFAYYGSSSGLAGEAHWTAESNQSDSDFGASAAAAGDVNGDGYDDVIVGAPRYYNSQYSLGRAYLFLGPVRVTTDYQWSAGGETAREELGYAVATAGDVNGDGYSDVVVGAPSNEENAPKAGKVYLFYGSPSGLGLAPAWTALGEAEEDGFGGVVGTAGDLNGDGYDDLVVGAPGHGGGKVYVYYGSATGLGGGLWTADGQYGGDEFGSAAGTAGDVNRDGYDDLVVGAGGYPDGSAYGKVYLYHGGANGLGTAADWVAAGQSAGDRFGGAVGTAGDVNADGYGDVVIGVPLADPAGRADAGRASVYYGADGGLPGSAGWSADGAAAGDRLGAAVAMAGDVNGDGYSDLIIGAPFADGGGADAGRASVFQGAVGGLPGSADWVVNGAAAGTRLGAAVGTAGDMDGDGYADVVIGAYGSDSLAGEIQIYQGSSAGLPSTPAWTASGEAAADRLGLAVGTAGDVNGDGFGDVIAGAPGYDGPAGANAGRATVYHGMAGAPGQDADGSWLWNSGTMAESAGDLNGDGYSDVVAGNENQNRAWVFYGSGTGLAVQADWTSSGAAGFGRTVGAAGDVNGDGYADLLVAGESAVHVFYGSAAGLTSGTPDWSAAVEGGYNDPCAAGTAGDVNGDGFGDVIAGSQSANRAWVYYGSPTGLPAEANWTTTGADGYGGTVGTAGDVNGDGFADVVLAGASTLYVYHGDMAGLTPGTPDWSFAVEGDYYTPCTAGTAGDVNGDGYADLIAGAPYAAGYTGKVYLFFGSAWGLDAPLAEIVGEAAGDRFGSSAGTAGDVNGDGFADVLVGAPRAGGYSQPGAAYLYFGSSVGLRPDQEPWIYARSNVESLGKHVAGAGDVNGDGFADLLINAVYTYYWPNQDWAILQLGNDGGGRLALARQTRGDGSGMLVQPWGRATRDSFSVTLHAVHPLGRGRARLQVQACPSATPFGDESCLEYTAADWTETVDAAGVDLSEMAEWLEEDTLYRWRARLLYDSPFSPRGPWHRFLGQSQEADVRAGRLATDLQITKTMMPTEELELPAQITYTLSYVSAGGPAAGVVITDILPASLDNVEVFTSGVAIVDTGVRPGYVWWVGDMAAGEQGVITIAARANATRFVNTAEIAGTSRDVNPLNNVAMVQTHVAGIIFVDASALGADNGSTWVDAYTDLQDALVAAASGDQIWVAEGVYKPTTGANRAATFALADGVAIYGGFAGNEAYLYERDWHAQPTVLSGDIGTVGNNADNVYHVVTAQGVGSTAVLDGFVITGGRATGEDTAGLGGGIHISGASPTLRALALLGNTADQGGGVFSTGGSPVLANVVLSGNAATTGGGLYNEVGSPALINATFSENSATLGGALYDAGGATLVNCIVWDEEPAQSLIAGGGATSITYSDVRGGAAGTGNLDADPQFVSARGSDGLAGTLDDDLRLHTTLRFPSPVIDQGNNSALPADAGDLDGDGDVSEPLPLDMTARARLIGFTALPPMVDMGALEANIVDVLAEGDALLAEGTTFRTQHLQLLSADTPELALQNYSNFNDGEWYYAFCSDYDNVDADGYCPETGPDHVRNDLLDTVDVYRVAVSVWPTATWTTRDGEVLQVWQRGGQGVVRAAVEIGNDHLIFGNEYLVDATDYRFSTAGMPYADQIIAQELDELGQAARQFELIMDLIFRAFSEWRVGDYCNSDQFEAFGMASSLLMSALDETASRYYMLGDSDLARDVYLEASRNQDMHLAALATLAEETDQAYLVNGSWEMLNNVSRMRDRARQIEAGFDFFGFRPDYAPLQPYEQLLLLTEGPDENAGLLGTARDLENQAREAQRTYDTNASNMSTELDLWKYELDEQLFEVCGETEDLDGDGYGDYKTCEGGLMAKNWADFLTATARRALAWNHAQNIALQIQNEQEQAGQTIMVTLAAGREIAAADLAIGKLEANKTTRTTGTGTETGLHNTAEVGVEAWVEFGGKLSTNIDNNEIYISTAAKVSASEKFGADWKSSDTDTTETVWDPAAAQIAAYESIKDLKQAEAQAAIVGAASAETIKNLLLEQSEALEEWQIATTELNQVLVEHDNQLATWSRLVNLFAEAVPTIMTYNSHLLNPAYRLWRDSLTIQSSAAHSLAAQFAYLTARASEYELLTPFPNLDDIFKTRTSNDVRLFLDDLKVWHQALDLPGQLNRYPYTLSVAEDFLFLSDEQLDPDGVLTPEQLAQERYNRLQEAFAQRMDNGDLEIVFTTSLDQQRPGGLFVFSPNIWNNRIAGIGEPLPGNEGIKVNIITTEPVDAGMVEVVLVHDGQATYRNASAQTVVYDPATAVPVGYLVPPDLSPAYTTVVVRPDINGEGGLPNSGLVNLSVATSHWKLRIPASSWGNLDVSQIEDIEIILDTTGRALPGRGAEAAEDSERLAAGLEMAVPSQEWLQQLRAAQQAAPAPDLERAAETERGISPLTIPGVVGGSYYGSLVVTSPITISVYQLSFDLVNVEGALTGVVEAKDSTLSPEPIDLTGTAAGDDFVLASEVFTNVVNGRVVTQSFTLVGHAEEEADVLKGVYTSTITSLLPEPIVIEGILIATRPGAVASDGLVVEAGAWRLPVDASTPITVTLVDGLMQPIAGTGTVTFTTDVGMVVPSTVEMVDGVSVTTFEAGSVPGQAIVVATMGGMTGQVRIQVATFDGPTAEAGPDQQVDPGDTVTLDGSGSSDPNGDPLDYNWVQTGGEAVSFTPDLVITTFTAPASAGPLTFTLTVTDTTGLAGSDVTTVTVRNAAPTADAGPDQDADPCATVTLDGSGSSDPNGDALTYQWVQTGGEAVSFTPDLVITTFIAPASAGPLTFTLAVTDTEHLSDVDSTLVTITNVGPTADAGPDQEVDAGATVTLDGSGSSDPNGDPLDYNWVQTGGEAVSFTPDLVITTFTAPASAGPLTFALTVTDTTGLAGSDVTIVTLRNAAPTADAGPDQEADPGVTVTLDGSGSSDPNGDPLDYNWVQTGGTPVSFTPDLMITTFTAPLSAGPLTFALTVTDTTGLADGDVTMVTVRNAAPTAEAGPDQEVNPGATVTLDGSGSSDPNGDALDYYWAQTGGEAVSFAPDLVITTFTAPASAGPLTFALTVTDTESLFDTDTTVVTVMNLAPTAEAGPDQEVDPGVTVTLDGSGSSDPNGDALDYYWAQTGGEAVSFAPDLVITTFTAPAGAGPLTFALTVTDTESLFDTDTTVVTVRNLAPTAEAGPDQEVNPGAAVTLDGSGSSDPNGDPLDYNWVQTGGTPVSFTPDLMITTFTAPASAGPLTFALTVTDTENLFDTDTTVVTVRNLAPTAEAGSDQEVDPGVTVTLDGSGSSDPNGDPLVYDWVQTGGEAVSFAPDLVITTFTAPAGVGPLTFALTVTDTENLFDTDTTVVTVRNLAPTAEAGPDQEVDPGVTVTLDGSGSSDPNGDPLDYNWVQTGGEPVSFTPDLVITTFTAPASAGPLTFALTVTDTENLFDTDTTLVTVMNLAPTAEAGPNQRIRGGATVTLDGSASSDPNGEALTYRWKQTLGIPVSFTPSLSITTFIAPMEYTQLVFALRVTDNGGLSDTDPVRVSVVPFPTAEAGPDQEVDPGVTVTLDGSGSSHPNGDPLVYYWAQTGGEAVSFTPDLVITSFTAPASAGPLTFTLTVTDTTGLADSDATVVTVRNVGPTAEAGPDQQVDPGATVTLDGSGSSDPNGHPLDYYWAQTGGEEVSFTPDLMITTFTAPSSAGPLTFTLIVTSTAGLTDTDTILITGTPVRIYLPLLLNSGPQAQVPPDQGVTSMFAGSKPVGRNRETGATGRWRPIWPSARPWTSLGSAAGAYQQVLRFPLRTGASVVSCVGAGPRACPVASTWTGSTSTSRDGG